MTALRSVDQPENGDGYYTEMKPQLVLNAMNRSEFCKLLGLGVCSLYVPTPKKQEEPDVYQVKDIFKLQGGDRNLYIRFEDNKDIIIPDRLIQHAEYGSGFGRILNLTTTDDRYFTTK